MTNVDFAAIETGQGGLECVNKIDAQHQKVVDDLAQEFLQRSPEELAEQPDYGSITRHMNGDEVSVAFWHYQRKEDVDHIVFIFGRRLLIPLLSRKFISGVAFGPTTHPRLLNDNEVGDYD